VHDERTGQVTEVHCTYDPETRGGGADGRKVKGTIHWVSAEHALPAEARLYNTLFLNPRPDAEEDWKSQVNPDSLERLTDSFVEPALADAAPGQRFQFERIGYFCVDRDSAPGRLVFNRTVSLRDTWAKVEKAEAQG
jgi:glutaminyl-tRNA synthetase